jgi:hypothetical protein
MHSVRFFYDLRFDRDKPSQRSKLEEYLASEGVKDDYLYVERRSAPKRIKGYTMLQHTYPEKIFYGSYKGTIFNHSGYTVFMRNE